MDELLNQVMWGVICKSCGGLMVAEDGHAAMFFDEDVAKEHMKTMDHPAHPPELICFHVTARRVAGA